MHNQLLEKGTKKIILIIHPSVAFFSNLFMISTALICPGLISFFTQSITIVIQITTDNNVLNGHINPSNGEDVVISMPNHTPSVLIASLTDSFPFIYTLFVGKFKVVQYVLQLFSIYIILFLCYIFCLALQSWQLYDEGFSYILIYLYIKINY